MTIYTVHFFQPDAPVGAIEYKHSVLAEDASEAFNKVFQCVADAAERDFPDPATRPVMTMKITNNVTGTEEWPDPLRIKAYRGDPVQPN